MTVMAAMPDAPSALALDGAGSKIGLIAGHARAPGDTLARSVAAALRAGAGPTAGPGCTPGTGEQA
jgi:hypothetical protein